jgi:hypothetical protein
MSVFVALRTLLLADVDVAAITTTIAPRVPQEPTFPLITIDEIDRPQDITLDYAHPRSQVTAWAESYEEGEDLAKAIRQALQRYRGTVAGVTIQMIVYLNTAHIYDSETGRETFPVDFRVDYLEE